MRKHTVPAALLVLFAAAVFGTVPAAGQELFQGYGEGEYLWIGLPEGGTVESLSVRRGDRITQGAPLFALDTVSQIARQREARAALEEAAANLANLLKGRRPSEINAIRARIAQAEADLALARLNLGREEELAQTGAASIERRDAARAAFERATAKVTELQRELETANLPAREDEIEAARAALRKAEAQVDDADYQLSRRRAVAPADALVFDTFYRPGEFVKGGQPVVSLLPPENIKVRFFVPEIFLGSIAVGDRVTVSCDGCADRVGAVIRYIALDAEYTPPVLYSESARAKLVYLVEAWPTVPNHGLKPGQPVDVEIPR